PTPLDQKLRSLEHFRSAMRFPAVERYACAICGELHFLADLALNCLEDPDGDSLGSHKLYLDLRATIDSQVTWLDQLRTTLHVDNVLDHHRCDIRGLENVPLEVSAVNIDERYIIACSDCFGAVLNGKVPATAFANDLQIGDIPAEIAAMTLPERLLLAINRVRTLLYKLQAQLAKGVDEQYTKAVGHIIAFLQDVPGTLHALPSPLLSLVDMISVLFVGPHLPRGDEWW